MKKLDKRGFTLVELLAVIVIMGILLVIAVPAVLSFSQNIKNDMFCTKVQTAEKAAQLFGQDNLETLEKQNCQNVKKGDTPISNISSCTKVTIKALLRKGYLKKEEGATKGKKDDFLDPRGSTMTNENLLVYIVNKRVYAKYIFKDSNDLKLCDGTYRK